MKFFRIESNDESAQWGKYLLFGVILAVIIGSFFLQMSLGFCPVP